MDLRDLVGAPGVLPVDVGSNRVLIVDDDLSMRMVMLRILRRAGYGCAAATSTAEARDLMRGNPFGVVVTDIRMYAEDGLELVRYLADRHPDTFSIVVTGFADGEVEERAQRAGAYSLLRKPFEHHDLVGLVERAFEERAAAVALHRHRSG